MIWKKIRSFLRIQAKSILFHFSKARHLLRRQNPRLKKKKRKNQLPSLKPKEDTGPELDDAPEIISLDDAEEDVDDDEDEDIPDIPDIPDVDIDDEDDASDDDTFLEDDDEDDDLSDVIVGVEGSDDEN